jgi:hypothetical protein
LQPRGFTAGSTVNDKFWGSTRPARPRMGSGHVVIRDGVKLQPMKKIGDFPWRVEPFRHILPSRDAAFIIRSYHNGLKRMSVIGQLIPGALAHDS